MTWRFLYEPSLPLLLLSLILTIWSLFQIFIGFQWGKRRGLNQQADTWRRETDQRDFRIVQLEERLAAERRLTRRQTLIISQLSPSGSEPNPEATLEAKVFPWPKAK